MSLIETPKTTDAGIREIISDAVLHYIGDGPDSIDPEQIAWTIWEALSVGRALREFDVKAQKRRPGHDDRKLPRDGHNMKDGTT